MRRGATMVLALLVAGCGAGVLPPIHSEAERLEVARQLHAQHEYAPAAELLTTYVMGNIGAADVDEAIFLLGDCHLKSKDWAAATSEFERLLRDFPESDSSAAARFGLGEAEFAQSRPPISTRSSRSRHWRRGSATSRSTPATGATPRRTQR